nr:M56 family metallopeptidase [Streptomyces sp. HNM0574]
MLPPLVTALVSGGLAPALLARSAWTQHAPRLAATAWAALGVLFTGAAGAMLSQLLLPSPTGHFLLSLLAACRPWTGDSADAGLVLVVMAALVAPLATAVTRSIRSSRRRRHRHASTLHLVGRRVRGIPATVLDHDSPVAYCLPGRSPQVVVTSGALRTLTRPQLSAVLAHEWAHIKGRHHLPVAAAEAFGAVLGPLPLARHMRAQVPFLMELAADDRTLRRCSPEALAAALYVMAAGRAPRETLAAGGPSAALRIRRLVGPRGPQHPVVRGLFWLFVWAAPAVPLLLACCSL